MSGDDEQGPDEAGGRLDGSSHVIEVPILLEPPTPHVWGICAQATITNSVDARPTIEARTPTQRHDQARFANCPS